MSRRATEACTADGPRRARALLVVATVLGARHEANGNLADVERAVAFRDEALALPADLDYAAVVGLSTECRLKLSAVHPRTLGQAARIEGMTPAALTLVLAYVKAGGARRHAAGG